MNGKLRWLGLSFVEFTTADGKVIYFDPWVKSKGNPSCLLEIDDIKSADLVLVSHDHEDHIGSASDLCKNTGAILGGPTETMWRLMDEGLPKELVSNSGSGYLVGGGIEMDWVKVVATPAHHTSNTSCAIGHIVIAADGTTLYHTGDTSLTAEMAIYAHLYPLDIVLLPIGGGGTMDALQAAEAVRLMNPKKVMPMHFEWNPEPLKALEEFIGLCTMKAPQVEIIRPISSQYIDL
ncbi:MBL fold metallo-hydrolase [Vallitalea pronyensis]|uniref:MBL fold metallo-hydrolase n=1 Tax=Vallitalea pronyensis TaxID=1348613 RepID=A0A8J8SFJ3_9FIRM|nr:MBL fold metallo-hydrolase [Vallitalea pronyensis]QUI21313.1 MBL fold metallo-hydrolase [Vallitalea pronyensis]